MKIKFFVNSNWETVEQEVNDWVVNNPHLSVIDIKFQEVYTSTQVMVMYRGKRETTEEDSGYIPW